MKDNSNNEYNEDNLVNKIIKLDLFKFLFLIVFFLSDK